MKSVADKVIQNQSRLERGISKSKRKDDGIFLTNNLSTVDLILDSIDYSDEELLTKKILEPSCGNGVFIIRLLERVSEIIDNKEALKLYIEKKVIFLDIDPQMVERTKENIKDFFQQQFGETYNGKFQSFVYDFTKKISSKKSNLFDKNDSPEGLKKLISDIDYVVGNPPYVSLYGRRDRKKNEEQRIYYLNNYSQFPNSLKNGKINYVMLFIEQSINLLKDDGILSFIIDLTFFETAFEHTRKYLLENSQILKIIFNIKDFEVASGQIIIEIRKRKTLNNLVKIIDFQSKDSIEVNQDLWINKKDQYKFRFNLNKEFSQIIEKISKRGCKSLKMLYPRKNLRTCVMLLNMEERFIFDEIQSTEIKTYPYYRGSKGLQAKYGILQSDKYFHYDKKLQDEINEELKEELIAKGIKNKKRLGLGETEIYDNSKVYIRQSAKEVIASFDDKPSSANNSLYVFSLRNSNEESKVFLKFLTGYLNSRLITFYCQQEGIIRYSAGKQPQIKVSDLYKIPIPEDKLLQKRVSELVDKVYMNDSMKFVNDIDNLINDFFNLSSKENKIMKKAILNF